MCGFFATETILPLPPKPPKETVGIVFEPVEAYYDKSPQTVSFAVTNASGEVITPDSAKTQVYYKGPGDADWVPAEEFAGISNVTKAAGSTDSNGVVTVEVKVSIEGYEDAVSSTTARVMPRVVAEQTGTATKPFDNTPLTCSDHSPDPQAATNYAYEIYHELLYPEIYDGPPRDDWADAIGFADGDGLVNVPTTGSQTEVGSSPNTVDLERVTFAEGTQAENYALTFPEGTLTVTAGTFDASASPALKAYDGVPTNVAVTVTGVPVGVTPVLTYSYSETEGFVPASAFTGPTNATAATTVYCRVTVPGCGEKTVHADVTVLKRFVVEQAGSASKAFDNTPLVCGDHAERPAEELVNALAATSTARSLRRPRPGSSERTASRPSR